MDSHCEIIMDSHCYIKMDLHCEIIVDSLCEIKVDTHCVFIVYSTPFPPPFPLPFLTCFHPSFPPRFSHVSPTFLQIGVTPPGNLLTLSEYLGLFLGGCGYTSSHHLPLGNGLRSESSSGSSVGWVVLLEKLPTRCHI